jgi:hypothetical protein
MIGGSESSISFPFSRGKGRLGLRFLIPFEPIIKTVAAAWARDREDGAVRLHGTFHHAGMRQCLAV